MIYIVPVTVLSFALNIPKFMEVSLNEENGTTYVGTSETRNDPTFIFWYTLSLIWHPTLTTGVIPFVGLVYMNLQIFVAIQKTRKVFPLCIFLPLLIPAILDSQWEQKQAEAEGIQPRPHTRLYCSSSHSLQCSQSLPWCSGSGSSR